jgi:DNA-binding NtrC family response regulator
MNSENKEQTKDTADVLIIDDEIDICQLLVLILRHKNIHSKFVNSLKDARDILNTMKPRMIFLDNHLADGLGLDFIEYIRTNSPNSKIIMITAHNSNSNKDAALSRGAVQFIGKPFTTDDILNAVVNFL